MRVACCQLGSDSRRAALTNDLTPVGTQTGPVGLDFGPVGLAWSPEGLDFGPVGLASSPIGLPSAPVEPTFGPVGPDFCPLGLLCPRVDSRATGMGTTVNACKEAGVLVSK